MFLQISCIPDLIRNFLAKRCGLYTVFMVLVYGKDIYLILVHLIEYNDQSLVKQNVCDFFLLPAEQFQAILGSNKSC